MLRVAPASFPGVAVTESSEGDVFLPTGRGGWPPEHQDGKQVASFLFPENELVTAFVSKFSCPSSQGWHLERVGIYRGFRGVP